MAIWPQFPDIFALIPLLKVYLDYGTGFSLSLYIERALSDGGLFFLIAICHEGGEKDVTNLPFSCLECNAL